MTLRRALMWCAVLLAAPAGAQDAGTGSVVARPPGVVAVPAATADPKPTEVAVADHPLLPRPPGATVTRYSERAREPFELPLEDVGQTVRSRKVTGKLAAFEYRYARFSACLDILRKARGALWNAGLTLHEGVKAPHKLPWGKARWLSAEGKIRFQDTEVYVLQTCEDAEQPTGHLWVLEVPLSAEVIASELEKTGQIALYTITFALSRADLSIESARTLSALGQLLSQRPSWRLRIEGHTDNVGPPEVNLELSKARAEAVRAYLVKRHQIDPERLVSEGHGDSKPIGPNTTPEGRARNRRVQLSKL